MDIVVRTPHGDADVSIASHSSTTTLGEAVAAVTGQAVPRLVLVDGDAVDAASVIDDVALAVGSVITSEPSMPPATSDADVDLLQVAGHGAGRVIRLAPGRYRIGPGRRSSADELEVAPVERSMFELVVDATSSGPEVSIVPEGSDVAIDGIDVDVARPWHGGTLTVGARAFELDRPARSDPTHTRPRPDRDGTVPFSRPPRRASAPERRPVVDALRDATLAAPTLWERRPGDPDAFVVPIGVRSDDARTSALDLASNRAVAVTGSERFRGALVRSLVVEAVTLHGPADLELVVLTDPDRVGGWDWAKWLPHLRRDGRLDGQPAIWSTRHDISRWSEETNGEAPLRPTQSRLTLVILDDPGLWNRRDSPARAITSSPPDHVRLIALCDDGTQAPAACTIMISEDDDELARIHSFTGTGDDELVRPALTEASVAVRVARALAPLADVDLVPPSTPAVADRDDIELSELMGASDVDEVLTRWGTADARPSVSIGRRGDEVVELPVDDAVTVVVGASIGDAFDVAATSLLAQCIERSPDQMWIAPMVLERTSRSELLWQLPHATDRHDVDAAIAPGRLLERLRTVLAGAEGPGRIVLVTEAVGSSTFPGETWLSALADGVRSISGLAMVVVTDRADIADLMGDTVIRVERRYDEPGTARRIARLAVADAGPGQPFAPLQPTTSTIADLEVRPFVVGRALTPLERRLEQQRALTASAPDPALDSGVELLRDAASRRRSDESSTTASGRTVVPAPIPARVDLDELFANSPGDGVPIGLVDDPGGARVRTMWWEPGHGSMLVFGSRRSGMEQVITTIVLGVVDRFSVIDVRLVVIEASSARRRAFADLDVPMRVVDPDHVDELAEALDEVAAELDRRAATDPSAGASGPRMVVLIGDLVHLRRRHAGRPIGARIDEVVTSAGAAGSGVDIIAAAADLQGAGPFASTATRLLVGASSDHGELAALGVEHPSELDGIVGRCRSFPDGDLVQLATTDATFETLLARRKVGGTA